jgi:hypothetical protein
MIIMTLTFKLHFKKQQASSFEYGNQMYQIARSQSLWLIVYIFPTRSGYETNEQTDGKHQTIIHVCPVFDRHTKNGPLQEYVSYSHSFQQFISSHFVCCEIGEII